MNTFERLREERERLGLSQEKFGALGGVLKRAQINYEKGERHPDSAYLSAIAAAGVDVLYVLTGIPAQAHQQLAAQSRAMEIAGTQANTFDGIKSLGTALTRQMNDSVLSADEQELLALFRSASLTGKAAAIGALQGAAGATAPKISIAGGVVSGQVADVIHNTHVPVVRSRARRGG